MPSRQATTQQRSNKKNCSATREARNAKILRAFCFFRDIFCFARPLFSRLFFAQDDFAVAHQLVVQPQAVFVRGRFASGARRAAEQPHAGGRLKNVRRKRTAVHIEFHAQIAGVGDPGYLVAFIDHDDLRDESNEYGAFSHFSVRPYAVPGPILLILSLHRDDSISHGKNSCELRHSAREVPLRET